MNHDNDFGIRFKEWLGEVVTSKCLTLFEPEVESISSVRIGQARFISTQAG